MKGSDVEREKKKGQMEENKEGHRKMGEWKVKEGREINGRGGRGETMREIF